MDLPGDITLRLEQWNRGDPGALENLVPLIYNDLRSMARGQLRNEGNAWTVQPTELVHEVYLRLTGIRNPNWTNRAHFFGAVSRILRHILVDLARRRQAVKRAGHRVDLELADQQAPPFPDDLDLVALDQALTELAELDPRQGQLVELRFFGGLTVEETAVVMEISAPTVKREWRYAKAWLLRRLEERPPDGEALG